jgi:alkylated DNA repair dioxygenase AlkB
VSADDAGTGGLAWQPTLDELGPAPDLSFARLERHELDARSWVDVVPGWLHHHDELFVELRSSLRWEQRQRRMYDRVVEEPRLVAGWRGDELHDLPPRVEQARAVLSARYAVDLDSVLVNLYRDGRDAVAWHGDTVRKSLPLTVVMTVSLGHRRRFRVRPRGGGAAVLELHPGEGDLVVMGGRMQHDYEHTVPRERVVGGARMSVTMRHSRPVSAPTREAGTSGH